MIDTKQLEQLKEKSRYLIVGRECVSTPHYKGYVYLTNATARRALSKKLPRAYLEVSKGTPEQNRVYCSKQEIFIEHGEIPCQGKRTDLCVVADRLTSGKTSVSEIALEDPMVYHQYGRRTLEKVEDILNSRRKREWQTEGLWLYGKTGTGKSTRAYEGFDESTHYVWKLSDKDWQDGYRGQEIVIIDDFRGEIKYSELLKMLDKWPHSVSRRGMCPHPFLAKKVIITSLLHPSEVYRNLRENDSLVLMRRLEVVELKSSVSHLHGESS